MSGRFRRGLAAVAFAALCSSLVALPMCRAIDERIAVRGCVVHEGAWVRTDEPRRVYPYNSSCPFIDERQRCLGKDPAWLDWEWEPRGCRLPLFDAGRFLELLRNRVMALVGDSLGRNQYESLLCLLSAADQPIVSEGQNGAETSLFPAYNATVKLILSPYLVESNPKKLFSKKMKRKKVYLDIPDPEWHHDHNSLFDVILFASAGRWFLGSAKFTMNYRDSRYHQPLEKGKVEIDFIPKASDPWFAIRRAFESARKSLTTAGVFLWKTYSASHFAGGTWDQGGRCDSNVFQGGMGGTSSSTGGAVVKDMDPNVRPLDKVMRSVLQRHSKQVAALNVTHMSMPRNDAHPGELNNIAAKGAAAAQDCVHWCLPGVPDIWNRFLLVHLERKLGDAGPGPGLPASLPPTENL